MEILRLFGLDHLYGEGNTSCAVLDGV